MKQRIFQLLHSFIILYVMLYLGSWIAHFIPLGIPDSIWGLFLLFFGLVTKVIKPHWVFSGATLLLKYMAVLFVPVSVGIIKYQDLLIAKANILLIPNVISTCITLIFIGLMADRLFFRSSFSGLRKKILKKRAKIERVL